MMIDAGDGTRLFARVTEPATPAAQTVVLIHGWPLNADSWEAQIPALVGAGYRVVAYDRRGFGRSDQPGHGYDYDRFADDLAAVIDAVGGDRPVDLVGFSMGGGEIARYLSRHGAAKVRRVALLATVVPYVLKDESNPDGVPGAMLDGLKADIAKDRLGWLPGFAKQFYGVGVIARPVSQGVLDWTFAMGSMASPTATVACVDAFGRTDFRPDLAAFTMPTLIVHGTKDANVPIDPTSRVAAKAIPGARLIEYDGEAHGILASAADRVNADLLAFLGGAD